MFAQRFETVNYELNNVLEREQKGSMKDAVACSLQMRGVRRAIAPLQCVTEALNRFELRPMGSAAVICNLNQKGFLLVIEYKLLIVAPACPLL